MCAPLAVAVCSAFVLRARVAGAPLCRVVCAVWCVLCRVRLPLPQRPPRTSPRLRCSLLSHDLMLFGSFRMRVKKNSFKAYGGRSGSIPGERQQNALSDSPWAALSSMLSEIHTLSSGSDDDEHAHKRQSVALAQTPAYEDEIRTLQLLGFGRASARRALVSASGDVNSAAAALLDGRVAPRAEAAQAAVQSVTPARSKGALRGRRGYGTLAPRAGARRDSRPHRNFAPAESMPRRPAVPAAGRHKP